MLRLGDAADALADIDPVTKQVGTLLRVVRHQHDALDFEVVQDLRSNLIGAEVHIEAQLKVGVDGVAALFLKGVGLDLVQQTDSTASCRR